jgi:hypothetical protein
VSMSFKSYIVSQETVIGDEISKSPVNHHVHMTVNDDSSSSSEFLLFCSKHHPLHRLIGLNALYND